MLKVKITIEDKKYIVLSSEKEISFQVMRDFLGYKDKIENGKYIYSFEAKKTNLFVLSCLYCKRKEMFDTDEQIQRYLEVYYKENVKPIVATKKDSFVFVEPPSIDTYDHLMKVVDALPASMGSYRIPLSRIYEAKRVFEAFQHPYYPSVVLSDELESFLKESFPVKTKTKQLLYETKDLISFENGYNVKEKGLGKLNIENISKLFLNRPLLYENRKSFQSWLSLRKWQEGYIKASILSVGVNFSNNLFVKVKCLESNAEIDVDFYGGIYLFKKHKVGDTVLIKLKKATANTAYGIEIVDYLHYKAFPIFPVYKQSKINGITSRAVLQFVLESKERLYKIELPYIKKELVELLERLHFPKSEEEYKDTLETLSYIELFYLQLMFIHKKLKSKKEATPKVYTNKTDYFKLAYQSLPYKLTKGQEEAIRLFVDTMRSKEPLISLLSADVGAGKTLTTQLTGLYVVDCGYQVAMVAPTEILAKQLYNNYVKLISKLDSKPSVVFLGASLKQKEKNEILKQIEKGEAHVVVGTHSVFNVDKWKNLGLVVVDEEQKFGASQREKLSKLKENDNVSFISQTATPIPRSIAKVFYGDMKLVQMKEKPANRKPIETHFVNLAPDVYLKSRLDSSFSNIQKEIEKGNQVFIVAPAVEEETKFISVEQIKGLLKNWKGTNIGYVSGKDSKQKQDEVLKKFKDKELNVLVASSIVEVGIDISDATVMIVVGADRFGVSSLHQLRGRVGRSEKQSYCYLVSKTDNANTKKRLQSLVDSQDGFQLALDDLSFRGGGDLLGERQSGESSLKFSNYIDSTRILEKAREKAEEVYQNPLYRTIALEDASVYFGIGEE